METDSVIICLTVFGFGFSVGTWTYWFMNRSAIERGRSCKGKECEKATLPIQEVYCYVPTHFKLGRVKVELIYPTEGSDKPSSIRCRHIRSGLCSLTGEQCEFFKSEPNAELAKPAPYKPKHGRLFSR